MQPQRADCGSDVEDNPENLVSEVERLVLALPHSFVFHGLDEHLLHDAHERDL